MGGASSPYASFVTLDFNPCKSTPTSPLPTSTPQHTLIGDELINMKGISGGQRRRVSVGIELVKQPQVWPLRCAGMCCAVMCCGWASSRSCIECGGRGAVPKQHTAAACARLYRLRWQQVVLSCPTLPLFCPMQALFLDEPTR